MVGEETVRLGMQRLVLCAAVWFVPLKTTRSVRTYRMPSDPVSWYPSGLLSEDLHSCVFYPRPTSTSSLSAGLSIVAIVDRGGPGFKGVQSLERWDSTGIPQLVTAERLLMRFEYVLLLEGSPKLGPLSSHVNLTSSAPGHGT